jgi:hypothetical protein
VLNTLPLLIKRIGPSTIEKDDAREKTLLESDTNSTAI